MNAIELSTVGHTETNACGDCVRPQLNEAVIIETRSPHFYKCWEQVTSSYDKQIELSITIVSNFGSNVWQLQSDIIESIRPEIFKGI